MGYYDDTMSRITREQYQDYLERFLPYENKLIELATNNELLADQLNRNEENVENMYQQSTSAREAQSQRLGVDNRSSQQQSTNTDLSKSLTLASVQNETRSAIGNLQDSLLSGAAGSASQKIKDI